MAAPLLLNMIEHLGMGTSYPYCKAHHIHNFGKHHLVINHRKADLSNPPAYFISNKLKWQAAGITRIRCHRRSVEVYHETGKADGLDQYRAQDFEAISRHIALVAITYSSLQAAQLDETLLQKLQRHVQSELDDSSGPRRRDTQAQALWTLATFIATGSPMTRRFKVSWNSSWPCEAYRSAIQGHG